MMTTAIRPLLQPLQNKAKEVGILHVGVVVVVIDLMLDAYGGEFLGNVSTEVR